jgi:hypothetical protein
MPTQETSAPGGLTSPMPLLKRSYVMGLPSHGEQGDYDAGVELIAEGLPESYLECTPSVSPHGLHPFTFFLSIFFMSCLLSTNRTELAGVGSAEEEIADVLLTLGILQVMVNLFSLCLFGTYVFYIQITSIITSVPAHELCS